MKRSTRVLLCAVAVWLAPLEAFADGALASNPHRAEAPHFVVTSDAAEAEALPLKETRAEINIVGVMAHVRVTQVYANRGQLPLEAMYVFPGSTQAAVFGMRMTIGDRTIVAKIDRREAARKTYQKAKAAGKTASLLLQHRPNVFQMSVANIMPGDEVSVQLDYTELLVPTDGVYELVYPAVVGPRYGGEDTSGETWHQNPYMGEGKAEPYVFGVKVHMAVGMGIDKLSSPSHSILPKYASQSEADFSIGKTGDGNRDFVMRYKLRGGRIQTGLLRFEGKQENFFLLMMQPPKTVAKHQMPPREYVFIVDVSGSMSGFPLTVTKELVSDMLTGLRSVDSFNILFFEGGSYQLAPKSLPATRANVARALQVLDERRGGGGTNILAALKQAFKMSATKDTSRTFIAVTDGYVSVEPKVFQLIRENLGKANFFAFGIGSSVNRHLIEGMARAGMGEPFVVLSQADAQKKAKQFRKIVSAPALTHIKVSYQGFEAYDVEPFAVPDLLAERPLLVFGKYKKAAQGQITVSGSNGEGAFKEILAMASGNSGPKNSALRYLWARHRIKALNDRIAFEQEDGKEKITELGLRYNLLTQFTSFVAVDNKVRNQSGRLVGVKQPLPLPQGVSDQAVAAGRHQVVLSPIDGVSFDFDGDSDGDGVSDGVDVEPDSTKQGTTINESYTQHIPISAVQMLAARAGTDIRSGAVSAYSVGRFEFGAGHRVRVGRAGGAMLMSMPTLLRFGVTDDFEARLASTLLRLTDGDVGTPDVSVGAKLTLWHSYPFAIGALVDARFDFDDATPEKMQARALVLANVRLSRRLQLRTNLGAELWSLAGTSGPDWAFAYATELSFRFHWRLFVFGGFSGAVAQNSRATIDSGIGFMHGNGWQSGLSASVGLTDSSEDFLAGLFVRWGF